MWIFNKPARRSAERLDLLLKARVTGRVVCYFGLTRDIYDVGVAFDEPLDVPTILAGTA